ncbi:MAG: recombinase family protein [Chitinophagaceae bacterium]|nr:MAG: recombinase family protein [Chitinophagaceae bacterium]
MRILYARCSTVQQKTDRQRVHQSSYDLLIEDWCSGTIPFFEREGGRRVRNHLKKGEISELAVWDISRLGRDLLDCLNVIASFTKAGVCIHFVSQSLKTIDESGNQNSVSKLMISILATVAEMERSMIKERVMEGVAVARAQGRYLGRRKGSHEDVAKFLTKPKNAKALSYLKKGMSNSEAAKLAGIHPNTVTKIKKLGMKSF